MVYSEYEKLCSKREKAWDAYHDMFLEIKTEEESLKNSMEQLQRINSQQTKHTKDTGANNQNDI